MRCLTIVLSFVLSASYRSVDVSFFRSKDSVGWELIFSTPYLENCVEKMALNAKVSSSSLGDKMLAVSSGKSLNVVTINQEQIQEKGGGLT